MIYPTLNEIEQASRYELGKWMRFLPSPGCNSAGLFDFEDKLIKETKLLARIIERFGNLGGWTPSLSKMIGWRNDRI